MERVIIIGAGPAGIGAAFTLLSQKSRKKLSLHILEKNDRVGGLARTMKLKNHYFDLGPHRFYTKNKEVFTLWKKLLGSDFIKVKRLTRIYYQNKLFLYPIQLKDVLKKLGFKESFFCFLSFLQSQFSTKKVVTFEDWVSKKFGYRLYKIFFKTYTEKVWGIPCKQIDSLWASQRIKNLDFFEIIKSIFRKSKAKSLIQEFFYPKHGAGQMYEKAAQVIQQKQGHIALNSSVTKIFHKNQKVFEVSYTKTDTNQKLPVDFLFASLPITEFVTNLSPKAPQFVLDAAKKLTYRDHITVNFLITGPVFPDNWMYIHDPSVKIARITNYNSFSSNYTPDNKQITAISVEYFVFENDSLWKLSDGKLVEFAKKELQKIDVVYPDYILEGFVVREKNSYPTYYAGHKKHFDIVKNYIDQFSNVQMIGRGGLFKYNNMDHALYSGILAAKNFLLGKKKYDIWSINEDAEYLEISQNKDGKK